MKKAFCFLVLLTGLASMAAATNFLAEDFTPAQNGTLPATLSASYDPGVDAMVVPLATMNPAPPADHSGGDGYVVRVGDLLAGGGGYNWIFPVAPLAQQTDTRISGWVYVDWSHRDAPTPLERDYLLMMRLQNDRDPQVTGTQPGTRQGYWFVIGADSVWSGITPNPPSFKPFLMIKNNNAANVHSVIGSYGTADVTEGWHFVAFEIVGQNLYGYVDNVLVCQGTDSTFTTGYAAVGYYEDNGASATPDPNPYAAAWDNIQYGTVTSDVHDWLLY